METYEAIYERMKARWQQESGAECDEASDIAIRLKVLAGEIYSMQTNLEWLKRQLFPSTASGEYLDRFAEQRGLQRRAAVKATGTLRFSVTEVKPEPILLPRGTSVSTAGEYPVRVYTTEDSEIPPYTYSVTVPAEAEQAGWRGNIRIGTAVIPVNVPALVDTVTNPDVFANGADEESDTTLRARILDSYVNRPNGMNAAYYIALALGVEGIAKAGVVPKARGAGTVNVYVAGATGNVSIEKLAEVQQVINAARELNVDVLVQNAYSQMYDMIVGIHVKAGYSSAEAIAMCTAAFEDYLSTIPMGGRLYLSRLGKYLLDTGCIETYEFDPSMSDLTLPASKYFVSGDVTVEVQ